jgi:phosphoesterase RecJ-like protein
MKKKIAEIIREKSSFEIITHEWPDADAVGSSTALAMALVALGKDFQIVNSTPTPEHLLLTPLPEKNSKFEIRNSKFPEVSLLLDVSDMGVIGEIKPKGMVVVIDHHATNQGFGDVCWADSRMSSTSEMIYELLNALDVEITEQIATNIYMGIFGDTGGFVHPNTTKKVFEVAKELVNKGANPNYVADKLKKNKPIIYYNILCLVIQRMSVKDGICAAYVTSEELRDLNATPEDASGIVEELASIAGVELAIFLRDIDSCKAHCSLRSRNTNAARLTAQAFGGGGHDKAAGFSIQGRAKELAPVVFKEGLRWIQTA